MKIDFPVIKHISMNSEGIKVTYHTQDEIQSYAIAEWLIETDTYENLDRHVTLHSSICSRCGNRESGLPDEAGIFCRRCGRFMLNGQPGAFNKDAWKASQAAEVDSVEATGPDGEIVKRYVCGVEITEPEE